MKSRILLVIIATTFFRCQSSNEDFNPFDKKFDFHENFNLVDYDTIMGQCGYWNLTKEKNDLSIYYQFFLDESVIVAKGFEFRISELKVDTISSLKEYDSLVRILEFKPIDISSIKDQLQILGIKDIEIEKDSTVFNNVKFKDSLNNIYIANLHIDYLEDEHKLIKEISYFNGGEN